MRMSSTTVIASLAIPLLATCTTYTIENTVITQERSECVADRYEELIGRQSDAFRPGTDRDIVVNSFEHIAAEIWKSNTLPESRCEILYKLSFRQSPPLIDVSFPVEIILTLDRNRVCLNHDDFSSSGSVGLHDDETYNGHDWEYVENQTAPNLGVGRRKFLPVCFNTAGKIER